MKNLYEVLGITQKASPIVIKKAFRALALIEHPDKGGNGDKMGQIAEAYKTLSDPVSRHKFDEDWAAFQAADVDAVHPIELAGYLQAGDILSYSHSFRELHKKSVIQYARAPLIPIRLPEQFFESGAYPFEDWEGEVIVFDDVFTFIREKTAHAGPCLLWPPREPLFPVIAVQILMYFLSGSYYGHGLIAIKQYLYYEIEKIKLRAHQAPELQLYEGIFEIILLTDQLPSEHHLLIFSIKKITDFAKKAPDVLLPCILPVFYNKFFRNLYAYALHIYWSSSEGLFQSDNLNLFDGYQEAREFLQELKVRLSNGSENENLSKFIRNVKLLFNFEQDSSKLNAIEPSAKGYREAAFHFLDWLPVFIERSSRQILANVFLQIGIKFQQASRLETRPAIKMSDERLALKMYLTAVGIGNHATPDVEIYANTQVLKYISVFHFQDSMLHEVTSALKKRTLAITDVFPFFESHQSNISLLRQENKMIHLMRHLLQEMIGIHEYNKSHSDGPFIDHSAVTLLYQAYEACLKNWYQEEYDPAIEKKLRLDLMEELLFDNGWSAMDVEQHIDSPWIMVDRDEEGWLKPTRSLPYVEEEEFVKYRTVNGAEVNHATGEINFFMIPWTRDRSIYEKVFTLFDLQEMLEKNISGALFSLDPVDPDKPYHPFNLMRFSPSQLCESELLHTMLLTDYVLKFLTTHQEVQGRYPFEQRPVASMIEHLPLYLRQIIDDFHTEKHTGAMHRFWIEAEEIDISLTDESMKKDGTTRVGLGNLKMVVKKHRMERDIHGELKDVGNEDDGWPIYVLTARQMHDLERGIQTIDGHAMIFIHGVAQLFYWENHKIIKSHVPVDYRETLIRLFIQPRDPDGKIGQNTKNMPLLYRATKEMARQSGLSHRYSAEFIFAHEFTTHYDEFAQYLPEFGRLKELSKMTALIRILNNIRHSNQESLLALSYLLAAPSASSPPDTNVYKAYHQNHQQICHQITSLFMGWRRGLASSVLQKKWGEELNRIKTQIGSLTFSIYSTEVNEACQRWHTQVSKNNPGVPASRIWDEVINPKKSEIATQLSEAKKTSCRSQLTEIFSSHLSLGSTVFSGLIEAFLLGNINPLAEALILQEKSKAQAEIKKQFPESSTIDIALAIDDGGEAAATRIATEVSHNRLREQKKPIDALATGFVAISLGKHEEPINLEGQCMWVPASVRHEVRKDGAGLSRYSFFVYGGVNVQPRMNVVKGGAALSGSRVGGGAFNRDIDRQKFQSHHIVHQASKGHQLLAAAGFNIHSNANRIFLPTHESHHPTRTIHRGGHTKETRQAIESKMTKIFETGQAQNWSQSQYRDRLRTMLSESRQELRAGRVALNSKCRPELKK